MLLTIDIGNTNIYVAVWQNGEDEKICSFRFATMRKATSDEILLRLSNFFAFHRVETAKVTDAVIANVVPDLKSVFAEALKKLGIANIVSIADVLSKLDLLLEVDNKGEVGEDRIANAYAARSFWPQENVIVVDMGTATTYDVVLQDRGYVGGVITPGLNLAIESLTKATSQLPRISLQKPKSVCGKNTISAFNAGVFFGYVGQVNYIIDLLIKEQKRDFKVVSTGGLSSVILESCPIISNYEHDLTIKGLKKIFEDINELKNK